MSNHLWVLESTLVFATGGSFALKKILRNDQEWLLIAIDQLHIKIQTDKILLLHKMVEVKTYFHT